MVQMIQSIHIECHMVQVWDISILDAIEREGILMMKECHVFTGEAHTIVFCSSQQNNNCLIGIQP